MTEPQLRIVGLAEFTRTCKKAGIEMEQFKEATQRTGQVVSFHAMSNAPKVSGRLASSIRPGRAVSRVIVYAGSASVPYAGPIHWGWPSRNIRSQPFLTDAGKQSEPEWTGFFLQELIKIVDGIKGA